MSSISFIHLSILAHFKDLSQSSALQGTKHGGSIFRGFCLSSTGDSRPAGKCCLLDLPSSFLPFIQETSGESLHDGEEQPVDLKILLGHPHTGMCASQATKFSSQFSILYFFLNCYQKTTQEVGISSLRQYSMTSATACNLIDFYM